jgi:hypothetical protein
MEKNRKAKKPILKLESVKAVGYTFHHSCDGLGTFAPFSSGR